MPGNGDGKGQDAPSPGEYERLKKQADVLRETSLSDQSARAQKRRRLQSGMHAYVRYTGIGMQFVLVVVLGVAAGYGLDWLLGTQPWLLLVGAMLGSAGAMIWVVRTVLRMESGNKQGSKQKEDA
ncbi:MAG: AtpZ/AtpI family protein [Planctomycetes bacterium]|nr:AtpZ/AtpI family protein [Planctomycetota bacterium]MCB9935055.1 AtpZ/AtpI family protein [Planctomycetota bacterium]